MIQFRASYLDGLSSSASEVTLLFDGAFLHIQSVGLNPALKFSLDEIEITPPLGKTNRSIILPNGARCETDDIGSVAWLEDQKGSNMLLRTVHFLEKKWSLTLVCLIGLILFTWTFMIYGIPFLAKKAAYSIPPVYMEKISRKTAELLDDRFFKPSELDEKDKNRLSDIFSKIHNENAPGIDYRIEFRKSPMLGANALALPSGLIFMTDELVEIAQKDDELIGIMAHEMAHVDLRHGVRSIIQNTGVFLVVSILVGDISSITNIAAALPTLLAESGYSRQFEKEADESAALYLIHNGYSTKPLQDILIRITKDQPKFPGESILSTHPQTQERIDFLKKLDKPSIIDK